jgi:hypothetical protein
MYFSCINCVVSRVNRAGQPRVGKLGLDLPDDGHTVQVRSALMSNPIYSGLLPRWIKTNRNLDQFWQFIKNKIPSYAERRSFLYEEPNSLLERLETKQTLPAAKSIDEILDKFSSDGIHAAWKRALERKVTDPEGAITIS